MKTCHKHVVIAEWTVCQCACRPVQHGQPSFHRSVSQPVDMDLSGLASFPGVPGWKGASDSSTSNPSAMWRTPNVASAGWQNYCHWFTNILCLSFSCIDSFFLVTHCVWIWKLLMPSVLWCYCPGVISGIPFQRSLVADLAQPSDMMSMKNCSLSWSCKQWQWQRCMQPAFLFEVHVSGYCRVVGQPTYPEDSVSGQSPLVWYPVIQKVLRSLRSIKETTGCLGVVGM